MQITPYLHFDGRCAEAIEFYQKALGAEVEVIMRFKDAPPQGNPSLAKPEMANQVMHSSFKIGDSKILASDCGTPLQGFSLTLSVKTAEEVDRFYKALAEGGQPQQPPAETFFSKRFGMLNDKFGVNWILLVPQEMNENVNRKSGQLTSA